MTQSSKAIAVLTLMAIASAPGIADDGPGLYSGAGAGYLPAGRFDVQLDTNAGQSQAVFGGFRLNSRYVLEGFYADIKPATSFSEVSSNFYTQSFLATSLTENTNSSVAGVSVVATMKERGPFKPFARAGLHSYEPNGGSGLPGGDGKLMLGAGADIDLSRSWKTRFEWERYSDVDQTDRSIFSVKFEYRF